MTPEEAETLSFRGIISMILVKGGPTALVTVLLLIGINVYASRLFDIMSAQIETNTAVSREHTKIIANQERCAHDMMDIKMENEVRRRIMQETLEIARDLERHMLGDGNKSRATTDK
jgi:hypothetical protein